jgi:hypothetical protein
VIQISRANFVEKRNTFRQAECFLTARLARQFLMWHDQIRLPCIPDRVQLTTRVHVRMYRSFACLIAGVNQSSALKICRATWAQNNRCARAAEKALPPRLHSSRNVIWCYAAQEDNQ